MRARFVRDKRTKHLLQGVFEEHGMASSHYEQILLDIPQMNCMDCKRHVCCRKTSFNVSLATHTDVEPFTSASQRRSYNSGETVLVAVQCNGRFTVFVEAIVLATVPNIGCFISPYGTVPFRCIYNASPDWPLFHRRCRNAIIMWLCCVKRTTRMCRNVRKLIAPLMWATRDDREWEEEDNKGKFKAAARKRLNDSARSWKKKVHSSASNKK